MSMKRISIFLVAVGMLLAFAPRQCPTATGAEGASGVGPVQAKSGKTDAAWGNPVAGQAMSVTSEKATYACGEPIFLTVHLKNEGTRPVFYPRDRLPRMDYSFDISLPDGTSVSIATAVKAASHGGFSEKYPDKATLQPGKEFAPLVPLNTYRDLSHPGKYTVSARMKVAMPDGGFSLTEAVSNKFAFDVVDVVAGQLKQQRGELKDRRDLNFNNTWITNDALEYLDGLTQLEGLRLRGAENITDAGLERLKRLPALERLDISGTRITDSGLKYIKRLLALKTLDISQTKITDTGLENLRGMAGLESLALDDDEAITDAGLTHLRGLTQLQVLCIRGTRVDGTGLRHLKALTNLDSLHLGNTQVGDAGLEHLKALAKLEWLYLGNTAVTDAGLEHLKGLANLQWLDLGNTPVTDAGPKHLMGLAKLEHLNVGATRITDAGLVFVKGYKSLNSLFLDRDAITDAGLENLEGLTQLSKLSLMGTPVTDVGMGRLRGLKNLYWLELAETRVTAAGVKKLKQELPKCVINVSN